MKFRVSGFPACPLRLGHGRRAVAVSGGRSSSIVTAQPFDVEAGAPVSIAVSIGVASWPAQADSAQTLVTAADAALYAAKQNDRNRGVRYEPAPGQPSWNEQGE